MSLIIKTSEEIRDDILSNISSDYEKSKGNITYDIPASVALELELLHKNIKENYNSINVDTLKGAELSRFVKQRRGIYRKLATYSIGKLNIVGSGLINKGDLFETATGLQFEAVETKSITNTGTVSIKCNTAGSSGNIGANSIVFIPVTIAGIVSVTNDATYDGFDEETDENLRQRYYQAIQAPPTSGNMYHYLKWSKEVVGVGDAKVFPLWNGDNTVKIIVIDRNKKPASESTVKEVQEYIDPKGEFENGKWTLWGAGAGQAPIGAYCTVSSAIGLQINIECDIKENEDYTLQQAKENIKVNIEKYLEDIAFKQNYISYAMIGSIILTTDGVKDYTLLKINSGTTNIDISDEEVAILGTINIT